MMKNNKNLNAQEITFRNHKCIPISKIIEADDFDSFKDLQNLEPAKEVPMFFTTEAYEKLDGLIEHAETATYSPLEKD